MLASRFPHLINPPWRECVRFTITRNKFSSSVRHGLHSSRWAKSRDETNDPTSTVSVQAWDEDDGLAWEKNTVVESRDSKLPTSIVKHSRRRSPQKPPREIKKSLVKVQRELPTSTVKKNGKTSSGKTPLKKNITTNRLELEIPEQASDALIQTQIGPSGSKIDSLGRQYELRYINCRPAPMTARIYRPEASSSCNRNKILYLPSTIPNSFFPSHDNVISTLSQITSSTIIYPVPTGTAEPFPQSIQNLLRIYDATTENAPTAIITSGIAATTATAMAMTEPAIKGIGIWGGIFDLTKSSATSTRWNRPLKHWEHLPTNALPPIPESTNSLKISRDEFKALRRHYYPNPETWLDPFASPLAFFRRSAVDFSRMNLTEINGEAIRQEMVKRSSYSESDWEAKVYIYPRIDMTLRLWNLFPPANRQDFPKIRIVAPEQEGDEENESDVVFAQAMKFRDVARNGLENWLKRQLKSMSSSWDSPASTPALGKRVDGDIETTGEAEMFVKVDTLSKEDTGVEEVNSMAHWIKCVLEGPEVTRPP